MTCECHDLLVSWLVSFGKNAFWKENLEKHGDFSGAIFPIIPKSEFFRAFWEGFPYFLTTVSGENLIPAR